MKPLIISLWAVIFLIIPISDYGQSLSETDILVSENVFTKFQGKYNIKSKILQNLPSNHNAYPDDITYYHFVRELIEQETGSIFEYIHYNSLDADTLIIIYDSLIHKVINTPNFNILYQKRLQIVKTEINSWNQPLGNVRSSGCGNSDFEVGSWSGWQLWIGEACTSGDDCITNLTPGTGMSGTIPRHEITNGAGTDPNSANIELVNPFTGNHSLKLGNQAVGRSAERIAYTFTVVAGAPIFTYDFAAVLQAPGHDSDEEPFLNIEFLDINGNQIAGCANYHVVAGKAPGFHGRRTRWKDWARISVDLSPYIGQQVTVQFTVSDCTQGGHFGYAYIDAICQDNPKIELTRDCDSWILTAPDGYEEYIWSNGERTRQIRTTTPGVYSVIIRSEAGCDITPPPVTVAPFINPFISDIIIDNVKCNGNHDGTITVVSPNPNSNSFVYSLNGGAFQSSPTFGNLPAGNYTIEMRDSNGCSVDTVVTVTEPAILTYSLNTTDNICFGESNGSIIVNASGGTPPIQYNINGQPFTNNNTFSQLPIGVYIISIIDANKCSEVITAPINEPPPINIAMTPDNCYDDTAIFVASANGGSGNYTFVWNNSTFINNNTLSSTFIYENPEDALVSVFVIDINGCSSDTLTSRYKKNPQIDFTSDVTNGCEPLRVVFTNNSNARQPIFAQWTFSDGRSKDSFPVLIDTFYAGQYDVTLSILDSNGCFGTITKPAYITSYELPIASFNYTPEEVSIYNNEVLFNNTSTNRFRSIWTFIQSDIPIVEPELVNDTSYDEHPLYAFPPERNGNYDICLEVITEYGCRDTICQEIIIPDNLVLLVPNVFTPNGDNNNDFFKPVIQGINPDSYIFRIYDRWGTVVFETNNRNEAWDGKVNGTIAKDDVYIWQVVYKATEYSETRKNVGHVTILK